MASDPASSGHRVGQHEQPRDGEWMPTEALVGDACPEAALRVVPAQSLLDGRDLRLDLDDQDGRRRPVPSKRIDGAAVAVPSERHLKTDLPAPALEQRGQASYQTRMTLVEESIELAAPPPDVQDKLRVECAEDATEHADAEVLDMPALEGRHPSLADRGATGEVGLTPAEAMAQGTGDAPEAKLAHAASVRRAT